MVIFVNRAFQCSGIAVSADSSRCLLIKDGKTPLHIASKNGLLPVVQQLISKGAALDQLDSDHRAPLHMACENNHLDVVLALLVAGAAIDIRDSVGGLQ